MGFTTKNKSSSNSREGWGMGFLLVLFPDEHHQHHNHRQQTDTISKQNPHNFNLFSSSSSLPLSLKRTNSTHLLHKAQSTISICLLLLFTTFLLFTLSTLPSSPTATATGGARRIYNLPRRHLSSRVNEISTSPSNLSHALQGMGSLYRRGTRAMSDLIVAHAAESLTLHEFKLFLRLMHRSGLTSKSDLLFIFPSKAADFDSVILQENDSFSKLVTLYSENLRNNGSSVQKWSFDATQFVKMSKKEKASGEPIWGRRIRGNFSEEGENESTRPSYGSVVGFDVDELDPENSISGFLDNIPMGLRRWACYPMLLGRVRRNFKHVMLVDVKEILVLSDQLVRVRSQPESVLLHFVSQSASKHGKKNSDKTQSTRQKLVNPAIISGGLRGVRRLSNAMLTAIVRATTQRKRKNSVTETGLLSQLVENEFVLKNVNLIVSTESVPEFGSVIGSNSKSGNHLFTTNYSVIRRGNSNLDVNSEVMKHICSFPLDSKVYGDC